MKLEEMRKLKPEQLEVHIMEFRRELLKESVTANRNKKTKKGHIFPLLRKQIARAYTVINQQRAQG